MLISWMLSWGDIPIYNLTTVCLNGTLSCVDFMDVIMGGCVYPGSTSGQGAASAL